MYKIKILPIVIIFTLFFSCNNIKKQNLQIQKEFDICYVIDTNYFHPVKFSQIGFLVNMTVLIILSHFDDTENYSISPVFYKRFSDNDIVNNLYEIQCYNMNESSKISIDTVLYYNSDELNEFIKDNNYLKGKSIYHFISEEYRNKINYNMSDLYIVLGAPLVDRKNKIVLILSHVIYKYLDSYSMHDEIFLYKFLNENNYWYSLDNIAIDLEWTKFEFDEDGKRNSGK